MLTRSADRLMRDAAARCELLMARTTLDLDPEARAGLLAFFEAAWCDGVHYALLDCDVSRMDPLQFSPGVPQ
jgi:hypothetical protein